MFNIFVIKALDERILNERLKIKLKELLPICKCIRVEIRKHQIGLNYTLHIAKIRYEKVIYE